MTTGGYEPPRSPDDPMVVFRIGSPTPAEADKAPPASFYETEEGSVASSVWECPPCKFEVASYPVNERATIVSGALAITNSESVKEIFGPGEVVFAAKGSKMTWEITERVIKYYMTSA